MVEDGAAQPRGRVSTIRAYIPGQNYVVAREGLLGIPCTMPSEGFS